MRFVPPGTFKKKKANLMLSKTISFKSVANHFKSIFGRRNQKAKYKSLAKLLLLEILENRVVPAAPLNILLSKSTIAENAGINALVGRLTTEDTDLGDSFTYSFQTGPSFSDNSSFIISGSELRAATNFNSKTKDKYIIRLRSTDQSGLHVEKVFVITINAPTGSFNTIQDTGPSMNRVDIVFAGDGYTSQDIGNGVYDFHTQDYLNYIFTNTGTVDPFPRYKNFFNAHRVNVTSNQSGADKPLDGIFVDTALDASYGDDVNNPERALFFNPAKADSLVSRELAGAGFSPEMKMSPVNDDKYGGAANYGGWAVYAAANSIGTRIALHEAGHAFSSLADEYFDTGSGTFNGTDPWEVNVTSDPTGAKWARWLGYNQPDIGIVGVYEGGRYFEKGVYRPTNDSRMRSSSEISFNVVSREKIILDIYSHVDPLDGWLANSKPLLDPEYLWVDRIDESIIQMEWRVDGKLVPNANGSDFDLTDFGFGPGTYSITARAFDPTGFDLVDGWVRTNNSELEEIISWQVVNTRPSKFAPVVIMQPSGSTVIEGDQAIFTANAAGVPTPSVQWQVSTDGTNWLNISGADSTTFTTARTAASDSGKMYRAVFTNSKGTATTTPATLTVKFPPRLVSADRAAFTVDAQGTFSIMATGFPSPAFSIASGNLPVGVTLSPSGTLAGKPSPGTGGAYSLVIKASNGVLPDATQAFTLTVNQAPEITSTNQTTFSTGIFGSFSAFATGFPAPVFSIASGVLPGGITMSPSGTISGTPIPGSGGTYSFTIKAANGVNPVSVQSFILTVNQAPTFTSTNNATFTADIGGSFRVLTSGFPIAAFSIASGSLPAGVTLSPSGTLAGTPAPGTGGAYSLVIKASNGVLPDATQTFTLTVNQAPAIFSNNRAGFIVNKSGIHQFQATGYPSAVFSLVSGVLPGGLTLESDGRLQGIPVPGTTGPATIQVQASNSAGTFQQAFSLNIGQEGVYAVAVGGGMNQISKLDIFKNGSTELVRSFIPFPSFKGEFFVDSGDITGDGIEDLIVGSGKGSTNGHVVILDGAVLLNPNPGKAVELPYKLGGSVRASLYAFVGYSSGVAVRLADMNDDGFDDMVLAPGTGAGTMTPAHLRVWNGKDCMADFEAGKPLTYDYRWEMASFWAFGDGSNPGGGMALSVIRQYGPDLIVASQLFKGGSKVFRYDGQKALTVSQDLTGNLYLWGSGNTVVGFLVDGNQMYASAGTARITPDTVYVRNQKGEVQYRIDRIFEGSPGGLRLGLANVDEDLEEELLVVRDYDSSTRIYDIFSNKAALIDTLIPGGYSGWV